MKRPALLCIALLGWLVPVPAEEPAHDDNRPGRAVARLSLINGEVSVKRGDSGDWLAAALNAPLLVEDRVVAAPGARAEVQFDYYHRLRLASDSEVRLPELEWGRFTIQVAKGTVMFSALQGGDAQVEISTPAAAVRPTTWGRYRVTVNPDGSAEITVRSGEVEIFTPAGTQKLRPGKTMLVRLGADNKAEFQMTASIPRDAWDNFNEQRDQEIKSARSYQYVSRSVYGAEELDQNGEWVNAAPYGNVWRPYAAPGWAPYRNGRWSWVDYYGWTWVSYDPWGWAPYHWGRWFWWNNSWCWFPGAVGGVHWWRPGLVAWFGWGSGGFSAGVGVGFGWGTVGWVPLAPYEPCYRWWGSGWYNGYHGGGRYYGGHNNYIVNNTNITNIYRNARITNGVTVNGANDFSRGAPGRGYRAADGDLVRANLARGAAPMTPQRESLRYSDRDARGDVSARGASAERFYSRREIPRVERVSFDDQRRGMEQYARTVEPGRGGETSRGEGSFRSVPATRSDSAPVRGAESARGSAAETGRAAGETGRWRNVDERTAAPARSEFTSGRGESVPRSEAAPARGAEGWRSFGDPGNSGRSAGLERSSATGRSEARGGADIGASSDTGGFSWRGFGDPANSGRSESYSTRGGSTSSGGASVDRGSGSAYRGEAPRTGGGSVDRGSGSNSGASSRTEAPRTGTGNVDRGSGGTAAPAKGGETARPSTRGGSGFMSSGSSMGRWSTAGDTYSGSVSRSAPDYGGYSGRVSRSSPDSGSFSRSGGSGGTVSSGGGFSIPRSDPGGYSGRGSFGGGSSSAGSFGGSPALGMRSGGSSGGSPSGSGGSFGGGSSMRGSGGGSPSGGSSGGGMRGGGGSSGGGPSGGGGRGR